MINRIGIILILSITALSCKPDEDIELRQIKDIVLDASSDPTLKAQAVFYNPNNMRGRLKAIKVDIYINDKKSATIDQELKTVIPAKKEFTIPLEVKLAIKELGFMDTLFGMIGGKKLNVRYSGHLKLSYHGIPFRVPVNHADDVRISF